MAKEQMRHASTGILVTDSTLHLAVLPVRHREIHLFDPRSVFIISVGSVAQLGWMPVWIHVRRPSHFAATW
jgi:hypothetical protein